MKANIPESRDAKDVPRDEFDEAFRPVAAEIGFFAREWNNLHEHLGTIFSTILSPNNVTIPLAVWNSVPSDATQRKMLLSAAKAWLAVNLSQSDVFTRIEKLVIAVDRLSEMRNAAIHAPINILLNTSTFEFSIEPNSSQRHKFAEKLKGRNIEKEFRGYRSRAEALCQTAIHIWIYLKSRR